MLKLSLGSCIPAWAASPFISFYHCWFQVPVLFAICKILSMNKRKFFVLLFYLFVYLFYFRQHPETEIKKLSNYPVMIMVRIWGLEKPAGMNFFLHVCYQIPKISQHFWWTSTQLQHGITGQNWLIIDPEKQIVYNHVSGTWITPCKLQLSQSQTFIQHLVF